MNTFCIIKICIYRKNSIICKFTKSRALLIRLSSTIGPASWWRDQIVTIEVDVFIVSFLSKQQPFPLDESFIGISCAKRLSPAVLSGIGTKLYLFCPPTLVLDFAWARFCPTIIFQIGISEMSFLLFSVLYYNISVVTQI